VGTTLRMKAELEKTMKMECENESENDHFLVHFHLILKKNEIKNEPKMVQKCLP
jgi:hypothetical protein